MANRPSLKDQNIGVFFGGGTKEKVEKPVVKADPPKTTETKKETQPKPQPKQGKPIKQVAQPTQTKSQTSEAPASKRGLKTGWSRATFIMRDDHLDKLKALSYWDRKTIIEVITDMADSYLKNKNPKPIPPK